MKTVVGESYELRKERLFTLLGELQGLAVAFSGGVDSSVLLHAARRVLAQRCLAVIADSPSLARDELRAARDTAAVIGARLVAVRTEELGDGRYRRNDADRCYHCKHALFSAMVEVCRREGIRAMAFGEVLEDLQDRRPGARAAAEFDVLAPLSAAGFSKDDVRRYAREAGLVVWDKPASACLASRIPTGTRVTAERLGQVELAERALRRLGLRQVRVRHQGERARLEVAPLELDRARELGGAILLALGSGGFSSFELVPYVPPGER